jgi:hypothetical protein
LSYNLLTFWVTSVLKWERYILLVSYFVHLSSYIAWTTSLTVLLHADSSWKTHFDCGARGPVRPLDRQLVSCLAITSAFSFPGTPVCAGVQYISTVIPLL